MKTAEQQRPCIACKGKGVITQKRRGGRQVSSTCATCRGTGKSSGYVTK